MIKNRLSVLMAERGLKIVDLYNATGISKTTLMAIANNTGKGIQFETIDKLCNYLEVAPKDFFEYVPYLLTFSKTTPAKFLSNNACRFETFLTRGTMVKRENIHFELSSVSGLNNDDINFFGCFVPDNPQTIYTDEIYKIKNKNFFELINVNPQKFDFVLSINFISLNKFYSELPIQFRRDLKKKIAQNCISSFVKNKETDLLSDGKYKILISLWMDSEPDRFEQETATMIKKTTKNKGIYNLTLDF